MAGHSAMEQMQKLMRQLEDQEQFPGPAIPICDDILRQMTALIAESDVDYLEPDSEQRIVRLLSRFAFREDRRRMRLVALQCYEELLKASPDLRQCFDMQNHIGKLVAILNEPDILATGEQVFISACNVLTRCILESAINLRPYFNETELGPAINRAMRECMLNPALLADAPSIGDSCLRLVLCAADRYPVQTPLALKDSFYAILVLLLKRPPEPETMSASTWLLVLCLRALLRDTILETIDLDIWPLLDVPGLLRILETTISKGSAAELRFYLPPLIFLFARLLSRAPLAIQRLLKKRMLVERGSSGSPASASDGEGLAEALLRLSRTEEAVELSAPLRDLFDRLSRAEDWRESLTEPQADGSKPEASLPR